MITVMKQTLYSVIIFLFAVFSFSACDENIDPPQSGSSYSVVNYTDTGDSGSKHTVSSTMVDHSSQSDSIVSFSSRASDTEIKNTSSKSSETSKSNASSKTSSRASASSGSSTKTIVTYYYYDDEGEHSTDTEISINTESSETTVASDISSQAIDSEHKEETDTESNVISEPDTETETESDSAAPSDPDTDTQIETDIPQGEFTEDDLILTYGYTQIKYGQNIDAIVASIEEEPHHIDEIPNEENPDHPIKIYNFEHFTIETTPSEDGKIYRATGMQIFDDIVKTDKGAYVGMSADEAVDIYGNNMMIYGDEYRYYIGSKYMYLYIQNNIVANIGFGFDKEVAANDTE